MKNSKQLHNFPMKQSQKRAEKQKKNDCIQAEINSHNPNTTPGIKR